MPFEQFQTQVLLLHSEQSTLDKLSAGFSDNYAVHCVTSGIEALNTLGATPIHVIVSAQDLPGMSGLDALREAKKRSPTTIAILLAGTTPDDRLEALVDNKTLYQIVRGEITPAALSDLVETAVKSTQGSAGTASANERSAAVDTGTPTSATDAFDDTGEHIVMETGDNGSCIITDATGQFPSLKPGKIGAERSAAGRDVDVLVVSDDAEFLGTVQNATRGTHKVHHAIKPGQAEDFVRNFPVGILITDASLAGSTVEALAMRLRSHQRRLVAIVAGRRDDGEMLMDLINRGQVYRFLLKPVSPGRARLAIEASVKHHLEAPDHSFEGRPAPKTSPVPPAKPAAKAPARRAAGGKAGASSQAGREAAKPSAPRPAAAAAKPAAGTAKAPADRAAAKAADGPAPGPLDDAFDDGNSFTETMTGIAVSVGKSLSSAASSFKSARARKSTQTQQEQQKQQEQPGDAKPPAGRKAPDLGPSQSATKATLAADRKPAAKAPPKTAAAPKPSATTGGSDASAPSRDPKPKARENGPAAKTAPKPSPTPAPDARKAPSVTQLPGDAGPDDVTDSAESDAPSPGLAKRPLFLGAAAAAVIAFAAGAIVLVGGDGEEPAANRVASAETPERPASADTRNDSAIEAPMPDATPASAAEDADRGAPSTAAIVEDVRAAKERGDIFAPPGDNAIELMLAAMTAEPGNAQIGAELDALVEEAYGLAEAALLANRTEEADQALRTIELADPGSARLNFLGTQLDQQRLRATLDEARLAMREARFEEAGSLLARAESFAGDESAEIDTLSAELAAARSADQLDEVLALASERLQNNQLLAPENDSARYYFELARSIDENSAAASQGLIAVAGKLVLKARSEIDAGNFDEASALLASAEALDADSDEFAAATAALDAGRENARREVEIARREAERQEAEALAAEREAAQEPEPAPADPTPEAESAGESAPPVLAANAESAPEGADEDVTSGGAKTTGPAVPDDAEDDAEAAVADGSAAGAGAELPALETISMTNLTRTRYVPPQYPRAAQRRNQSGFVDVIFTVTPTGGVADVEVRNSEPGKTFVNAAVQSVEKWEFEPVVEDGSAVSKRVAVRMSFNLQ